MEEDEHGRNSAHYLETFSDRNVGFYRRRGYDVVGEFRIGVGTGNGSASGAHRRGLTGMRRETRNS